MPQKRVEVAATVRIVARSARVRRSSIEQLAVIDRKLADVNVLSEEGLALIEANAETICQEIGLNISEDAFAIQKWKEHGADVEFLNGKDDTARIRFPKGMLRALCKTAPSSFIQHARNPARNVEIGGKKTVFAPVYGPPFYRSYDEGRRYATLADFETLVKLTYMSPALHHSGGTVCEPVDIPVNKRHFDMVYSAPETTAISRSWVRSRRRSGRRIRWTCASWSSGQTSSIRTVSPPA